MSFLIASSRIPSSYNILMLPQWSKLTQPFSLSLSLSLSLSRTLLWCHPLPPTPIKRVKSLFLLDQCIELQKCVFQIILKSTFQAYTILVLKHLPFEVSLSISNHKSKCFLYLHNVKILYFLCMQLILACLSFTFHLSYLVDMVEQCLNHLLINLQSRETRT